MEILVYKKGHPKIQDNFTVKDLPELLKDLSALVWVDMESPTAEDEQVLLDVFKFHPLTVEDCRENRHYPKIEEFEDYIYFSSTKFMEFYNVFLFTKYFRDIIKNL